jgi:cyclophilin family peptidyl-prolyl cis-trans isomerase
MNRLFTVTGLLLLAFCLNFTAWGTAKPKPKKKDTLITITTDQGEMKLLLFDDTPLHKENFIKLAKQGFYDGTTFHRIINDFMIQGGDPNSKDADQNNDGQGGPGYTVPAEILPHHKHVYGAVAAARLGDGQNPKKESSGSQFYLVQNHNGTPFLDNNYTVYGQVIKGLDVIDKIVAQPKNRMDRPLTDIKMTVKAQEMKRKKISKEFGYTYP